MEALEGGACMVEQVHHGSHVRFSLLSGGMRAIPRCYLRNPRSMSAVGAAQMPVGLAAADAARAQHGCGGEQPRRASMGE